VENKPAVNPQLEDSWKKVLAEEFVQPYFSDLKFFLQAEKQAGKTIYPPGPQIFNAFNSTPFDKVKVVILGQDPYHGKGQAHGLCFSVPKGIKPPPSLVNIFKEIRNDLNLPIPLEGDLSYWAKQGVFLLNTILTVEAKMPASHQGKGWETFTDRVIQVISEQRTGVVFLLWGRFAQNKAALIDGTKHHILKAPHPSPFSAHSGFLGCKHFSQANALLKQQGLTPIDWSVR
jgi:uracil-DNA glycosylase